MEKSHHLTASLYFGIAALEAFLNTKKPYNFLQTYSLPPLVNFRTSAVLRSRHRRGAEASTVTLGQPREGETVHQWWNSLSSDERAAIIGAVVASLTIGGLATVSWFVVRGIPDMIQAIQARKKTRCRNAVADVLRPRRDLGSAKGQIVGVLTEFRPAEIEEAIRHWEERGLVYLAQPNRWIWQSFKLTPSGRFS